MLVGCYSLLGRKQSRHEQIKSSHCHRVNLFFPEMSVAKVNLPRLKSFKGPYFLILRYLYLFDPSW